MATADASLPGGLVAALHDALKAHAYRKTGAWYGLIRFLPSLAQMHHGELSTPIAQALDHLREESPQEAELLRLRYWKAVTAVNLAARWNVAVSTLYTWQRRAIRMLARHLWDLELEARTRHQHTLARRLRHLPPPTYTRLFGLEGPLQRLREWLLAEDGPRVVFIEGLGGLGKTTLAHAFVQRHLHAWEDVAWLCAYAHQPTWEAVNTPLNADALIARLAWQLEWDDLDLLPPRRRLVEMRVRLARKPYLVVWDDLLPVTIGQILPLLPSPPAATRFLITSRYRYPNGGAHLVMQELAREDALALLRHEIRQRGLPEVADEVLEAVYERLGGHPLALKLAAAHLAFLPAAQLLNRVHQVRVMPRDVEADLFDFIYRPLVENLPRHARLVLEVMPYFAPTGATYQDLRELTRLPDGRLDDALYRLVALGLLDFDPRPPHRYSIHRLTYVYLAQNHHRKSEGEGLRETPC